MQMITREEFYTGKVEQLKSAIDAVALWEYDEIKSLVNKSVLLINDYYETDTQYVQGLLKIKFTSDVAFGDGFAWNSGKKKMKNILDTFKFAVELHKAKKEISLKHFWEVIHPEVRSASEEKFNKNEYKDAVFASSLELGTYIKKKGGSKIPDNMDGTKLMEMTFGKPVLSLNDQSQSGEDLHVGYKKIFEGSVLAIRNPKAHGNFEIEKNRAMHLIFLCSLLFYKVDEAKLV